MDRLIEGLKARDGRRMMRLFATVWKATVAHAPGHGHQCDRQDGEGAPTRARRQKTVFRSARDSSTRVSDAGQERDRAQSEK